MSDPSAPDALHPLPAALLDIGHGPLSAARPREAHAAASLWRLKHRCGHFLGEWDDGVLAFRWVRCKEGIVLLLASPIVCRDA